MMLCPREMKTKLRICMVRSFREVLSADLQHRHGVVEESCQMNPGYQLFMQQVEQCSSEKKLYARVLPVMQSSGTGKSRLLNEVAKTVFTFPLCLRPPNANGRFSSVVVTSAADTLSGYPSGDQDVFKLLCQKPADSYDSGFFLAFLLSLFEHAQRAMYINLIFGAVLTSVV
jgi:hypothetical protein